MTSEREPGLIAALFGPLFVGLVSWVVSPTIARIAWSIAFVVVIHQIISLLGARLGMRATAR